MLDGQHARSQRLGGIALEHGHAFLKDDAAVIDLLIDKVRRRPGDLRAIGEHRLVDVVPVHARAAERRREYPAGCTGR